MSRRSLAEHESVWAFGRLRYGLGGLDAQQLAKYLAQVERLLNEELDVRKKHLHELRLEHARLRVKRESLTSRLGRIYAGAGVSTESEQRSPEPWYGLAHTHSLS